MIFASWIRCTDNRPSIDYDWRTHEHNYKCYADDNEPHDDGGGICNDDDEQRLCKENY